MARKLPKSALEYVLWSLVPYSEPNLKLAFSPDRFFEDLSAISRNNKHALRNAYYRGVKTGLIDERIKSKPTLTRTGQQKVAKFTATSLGDNACLMIIFDIPEALRHKRQYFRRMLQELDFVQVQKSVWVSEYDHRQTVTEAVAEAGLQSHVKIFESLELPT